MQEKKIIDVAYTLINESSLWVTALIKEVVISLSSGISIQRGTLSNISEASWEAPMSNAT